jgi:hypothetical protein
MNNETYSANSVLDYTIYSGCKVTVDNLTKKATILYHDDVNDDNINAIININNLDNVNKIIIILDKTVSCVVEVFMPYVYLLCCNDSINKVDIILPFKGLGIEIIQQYYLLTMQKMNDINKVSLYTYKDEFSDNQRWAGNVESYDMFVVSKGFLPIVYIFEDGFDLFFGLKYGELLKNYSIGYNSDNRIDKNKYRKSYNERYYKRIKEYLKRYGKSDDEYKWYYCLYYYKIMQELRLIGLIMSEDISMDYDKRYGGYISALLNMIEIIYVMPLYFSMILYVLLANREIYTDIDINKIMYDNVKDDIADKVLSEIRGVIEKAKYIYYGAYEIAKNMNIHSSSNRGVIAGKIYDKCELDKIKKYNAIKNKYNKEDDDKYIVLSLIDDGDEGILKNMYRRMCEGLDEIKKYGLEDDIKTIKENIDFSDESVALHNLLYNVDDVILRKQNYKVAAGYGLMYFVSMIRHMNGVFSVKTVAMKSEGGIGFEKNDENVFYIESKGRYKGTAYNMIVPIKKSCEIKNYDNIIKKSQRSDLLCISHFQSALHKLMGYEYYDYEKISMNDKNEKVFLENEIIGIGCDKRYMLERLKGNFVVAINMKNSVNDASEFIRSLSDIKIRLYGRCRGLIVFNISEVVVEHCLGILKYLNNCGANFWGNDEFVLIYFEKKDLYPCFILSGNTYDEFIAINGMLKNKHISAIPGAYEDDSIIYCRKKYDLSFIKNNIFFSGDGELISFDLLIKADETHTIFEKNIEAILKRESNDKY